MEYEIDVDRLRQDMMDDYGSAMMSGFPMAAADLSQVEMASGYELVKMAQEQGIDLRKYIVDEY